MNRAEFEELVAEALDEIPPEFAKAMQNVVVVVEDDAPRPTLLGLYEGYDLTRRGMTYTGVLPDKITIFRNSILGICRTEEQVKREVLTTVIHEVGHHFGIGDERLHELGW